MSSGVPCPTAVSHERWVEYWAGELAAAERDELELHLMGCAACTEASARVAAISEAVRSMLPPLISRQAFDELRARGLSIAENALAPGERKRVVFGRGLQLLVHRLGGLELGQAERVHVVLSAERTGEVILDVPNAPFDRESGEVLMACQRHFAAFPPDVLVEVRTVEASGRERVATYAIPHEFEI